MRFSGASTGRARFVSRLTGGVSVVRLLVSYLSNKLAKKGWGIVNIDPGSDVPLFVQIAEQIEDDVFTGVYAEGDRVPSTNELAALLGINPHTVLKGMNILVDEGIIYKRRGMGMYVQDGAAEKARAKRASAFGERYVAALVAEAKKLGFTKDQVIHFIEKGYDHA